ncbi:MAG: UbiA family prenyltransferase, partial [Gammaproteobacteria bacterium]|nr:UbiA family prenyltransferase [Gammaproteobacteria bacterium]
SIKIEAEFAATSGSLSRILIKAMRPHQWAKNSLLFVPIVLAHSQDVSAWADVCLAFVAFSLSASSIYIINDLFDLEADRKHPTKRNRPFASTALSIPKGLILFVVLITMAGLVALQVNMMFTMLLLGYVILTTSYSVVLKLHALVDVFTLTSLYTLRIVSGAAAAGSEISNWLLAFSIFFFMSMAFAKRYSELHNLAEAGDLEASTRGYVVRDLMIVILFGVASGYISVMVMMLYIQDLQASLLYSNPAWLWLISFVLLYWISRTWLLSYRGKMDEDPVLFALHDQKSYLMAAAVAIWFWLAL